MNEYIESAKIKDRKLYQKFKDSDEEDEVVPVMRKTKEQAKYEEEQELENAREEIHKKALELNNIYTQEMEEQPLESSDEESEDDEKKWDCETIQTTLTNTDNHPGVIKTVRKVVKPKNKIELHK